MAETNVDTGVSGFSAKCGFLYEIGLDNQGWFTDGECRVMQNKVRKACGCDLRTTRGIPDTAPTAGASSPTLPPPSPTPAPPTPSPPSPTPAPPSPTPGASGSCSKMNQSCSGSNPCCSGLECNEYPYYGYLCAPVRRLRGSEARMEEEIAVEAEMNED
jgi:hypothetical protein